MGVPELPAIKTCRICGKEKGLSIFVKNKAFKSGFDNICRPCNLEKVKQYRLAGKRNTTKESKNYYHKHIEKRRAFFASRKKRVREATPSWVNLKEIEEIYLNRPEGYHVDHIIPLNNKTVCGLNVPWNLQYLPCTENMRKGNKW